MMMEGRSIALGPGEGKSFMVSGDPFTYKVVSQDTDGRRPGTRIKKSAAACREPPDGGSGKMR